MVKRDIRRRLTMTHPMTRSEVERILKSNDKPDSHSLMKFHPYYMNIIEILLNNVI